MSSYKISGPKATVTLPGRGKSRPRGQASKAPLTAAGITGHEALRTYLTGLFAAMPATTYTPDETWPIAGGYCGRWYAEMGEGGSAGRMRGFDLVILEGDRIALNEVYVHPMPA